MFLDNPNCNCGHDPGKLVDPFNKLIVKGCQFTTVIRSLYIVFIDIDIHFIKKQTKYYSCVHIHSRESAIVR